MARIRKSGKSGRKGQAVHVDFSALDELREELEALAQDEKETFLKDTVNELTLRLEARVIERTPTGVIPDYVSDDVRQEYWTGYNGGTLKAGWRTIPATMDNGICKGTIYNTEKYAPYVEYGHRQTPGRYIPALGKKLKKGWVKGKFMMANSRKELEPDIPGIVQGKFNKYMEGVFHAK
ncbi:MAG: HK97 gp10 family phage protein [Sporomusa sp.]